MLCGRASLSWKATFNALLAHPFVLDLIKEALQLDEEIQSLAQELYQQKSLLVMGRGFQFATCLEGALVNNMLSFTLL